MNTPRDQHDQDEHLGVVVGVDGSRLGLDAVRWAVAEARLRGLPLQILHAAPYSAGSAAGLHRARDILARAFTVAHRADPGVQVTTRRTEHTATASLLDAARHAELLVVGMGGGDRPQELLIGSVALEVSGHAPCPVAVVRGGAHRPVADRPVLVGVDDVTADAAALTVGFTDAHRHGSGIVVLHARPGAAPFRARLAGHTEAARVAAWAELAGALAPWAARFPDVPLELALVPGQPASPLLAAAVDARLLVLGTRGRRAPARALFGSTSRAVLRRSPVPVVVVSPDTVRPAPEPVPAATAAPATSAEVEDPHDRSQLR
ncbi:universal stress protein [Pseudonocardia hydrocarbonoxydans]|uniref:universal stress protein n=1 Tax=Pseudonocardia hydrocarbonoxydans TaxID=76726 RepID=UPI0031E061AC